MQNICCARFIFRDQTFCGNMNVDDICVIPVLTMLRNNNSMISVRRRLTQCVVKVTFLTEFRVCVSQITLFFPSGKQVYALRLERF